MEELSLEIKEKLSYLKNYIKELNSLAIGFSGGVDSTLLLAISHEVLKDKVIAITQDDPSIPRRELKEAEDFCKERGIRHIKCHADPMQYEEYRNNSPNRCYFCKKGIFTEIVRIAHENNIDFVAEGSNMDDISDYRPGSKASDELFIKSPLKEAKLYKNEIRLISKAMGLKTWSKPAYACLASRFVYGEEITDEKLRMIDDAEQFLIELGFFEERVRIHGKEKLARIEVPEKDIERLSKDWIRKKIYERFKELGFMYVTIDMKGYRMGSMNELIK